MSREYWDRVSRRDIDSVKEVILTGYKQGKPFAPVPIPKAVRELVLANGKVDRALDFGCGVGRNFPLLREFAEHVDGYDLPGMMDVCRKNATADYLDSDWSSFRERRYGIILAAIVLQHIHPDELVLYLDDMRRMTKFLLVPGRGTLDDMPPSFSLWNLIESRGFGVVYADPGRNNHGVYCFQPLFGFSH